MWKEDLWGDQRLTTSLPGELVWLLPDCRPRVLCDGLLLGRRPHDSHSHQHLQWKTDPVSTHRYKPQFADMQPHYGMFELLFTSFKVLFIVCAAGSRVPSPKQNSLQVSPSDFWAVFSLLHFRSMWHNLVSICSKRVFGLFLGTWSWIIY